MPRGDWRGGRDGLSPLPALLGSLRSRPFPSPFPSPYPATGACSQAKIVAVIMGWSSINSGIGCRKVWFSLYVFIYSIACSQMMQMTNMSGWFSSPRFPLNYPGNVQCSWNISIPSGYTIYLTFLEFDVEECGDSCTCDYVEVHFIAV